MGDVIKFPHVVSEDEIITVSMNDVFSMMAGQTTLEDIKWRKWREEELKKLTALGIETLRHMWDNVSDETSYYDGEHGHYDCSEIHTALNMLGDGRYCAV